MLRRPEQQLQRDPPPRRPEQLQAAPHFDGRIDVVASAAPESVASSWAQAASPEEGGHMFEMGTAVWAIAARSALVYVAVFVGLRLAGKRELGQMTVFDLVVVLLIANAVQNAMVGPDFSVQGGIVAAFVLIALNRAVALLRLRERCGDA
jgi:hypothetical protein